MEVYLDDEAPPHFSYDSSADLDTGQTGFYSDMAAVTFDDFVAYPADHTDPYTRTAAGIKRDALMDGGETRKPASEYAGNLQGEAVYYGLEDEDYMLQVDVNQNQGIYCDFWVRRTARNNGYRFRVRYDGYAFLDSVDDGNITSLASETYSMDDTVAIQIKVEGNALKLWIDASLEIDVTDGTHPSRGVSLVVLHKSVIAADEQHHLLWAVPTALPAAGGLVGQPFYGWFRRAVFVSAARF